MINRRQWSRALAIGMAGAQSRNVARGQAGPEKITRSPWSKILPGIWKATFGTPEPYTPVSSRFIPPAAHKLSQLPESNTPPIPEIAGAVSERGCVLRIPMPPGELIYGFGLQLLSFSQRGKKKTIRVNADP